MKSKKAREIIARGIGNLGNADGMVDVSTVYEAIEQAESDRDAKTVEAFCRACDYYELCVEAEDMTCDNRIAFCKIMEGE